MSAERTTWLAAWAALNQGGRLLNRSALEKLPQPPPLRAGLSDQLRDALTVVTPVRDKSTTDLSALLDVVLEELCGHQGGWRKGPEVGKANLEQLLDGTELKPRRVLTLAGEVVLAVFAFPVERLGVHKGRRSVAQALEYLRRRKLSLGLVTNGREWRLLFADPDSSAWVEWSADRLLDAEALSPALHLLRLVLSPAALTPPKAGDPSPLLSAIHETRRGQAALSKELGENVRKAVEHLLRARLPLLRPTWGERDAKDIYQAACHFVMRLVVVLFAESRELLPVDNPVYHQAYGLRSLQDSLERAGAARRRTRTSAWPRLLGLFRLLHAGSHHPQVAVPAYGGDLFRAGSPDGDPLSRALALLESPLEPPADETVYQLLKLLTRTTESVRDGGIPRRVAVPVDFTELTSEYIGILYEGLLDYELKRVDKEPILFLGLGDQPALPLNRLEEMGEKQLGALVEKATVGRQADAGEEDAEDEQSCVSDESTGAEAAAEAAWDALESEAEPDDFLADDALRKARERAERWAAKAAIAGRLVRAPRGKKGNDDPAWKAEVSKVAKSLIGDLKLPGELYLVRWGGTRKGAGTFYTRPQLTLPTVRRTLEPLIHDVNGKLRAPEEILALKVCDPAMGSGSFLVAALRVLTDAVVAALHVHGRIKKNNGHFRLECELLPDADRDQQEESIPAIVRRAVVEHCLYGVDLDALAVELARVSLWVETLDKRLPFTFLDHKLRCGDALVGAWLDRFRDYPLLAWWRQSPDEKWRGVTHEGDVWARKLKELRTSIVEEQRKILAGETSFEFSGASDDELRAALAQVRELYRRLRAVPATQPDKRADIWRKQVATQPSLLRVRQALDTWCALWFWPLEQLDVAPRPAQLLTPSKTALEIVKQLREKRRFFHWELEFPDVFLAPGSGFDAIVANPPWEIRKPSSREFFSDIDPLYRSYGKQEALTRQRELFAADAAIERRWLDYVGGLKDDGNFVRRAGEPYGNVEDEQGRPEAAFLARKTDENRKLHARWAAQRAKHAKGLGLSDPAHPFRHQGSADLNSYKLFVEQAHALLSSGGQFGLITPSGLYTDKGSADLRRVLLDHCDWRWLYGFENRHQIFDIHRSFKFAITIARKGGKTDQFRSAFMRHDLEDWAEAKGTLPYAAQQVRAFSPKSLSILEIRSLRDLAVLTRIYDNSVLLGDDSPQGWGLRYATEFHMTQDSKLFIQRDKAEEAGHEADAYGRWRGPDGELLLPLYEGRMIGQFDFSKKGWVSGKGRAAVWRDIPLEKKVIEPQFLMRASDHRAAWSPRPFKLVMMNISAATNARTMLTAIVPDYPANHALATLTPRKEAYHAALVATLNAFVFDWTMRLRLGGLNVSWFVLEESPLPRSPDIATEVTHQARLLCATASALAPLLIPGPGPGPGQGPGQGQGPGEPARAALTAYERLRLRCVLDAIVAALYGLASEDLRWILRDCDQPKVCLSDYEIRRTLDPKGFWKVDDEANPELRHAVLTLVAFQALEKLIAEQGGDRAAGISAFCALNNGQGWMLPETLRLADYGLGHDERAQQPQPVASRLGPRFLDWQLMQTPQESKVEHERHARAILGDAEFARRFGKQPAAESKAAAIATPAASRFPVAAAAPPPPSTPQLGLFEPKPTATAAAAEPPTIPLSSIKR